jgi:hypothetical protein
MKCVGIGVGATTISVRVQTTRAQVLDSVGGKARALLWVCCVPLVCEGNMGYSSHNVPSPLKDNL